MKRLLLLVFVYPALTFASSLPQPAVPDNSNTYGSICNNRNPDYVEDRYPEKIAYCERNVSSSLKTHIYEMYGIPKKCRAQYTIDHFIPLSIGGDNTIPNLWPEHKAIKHVRQDLEMHLYKGVRNGTMSQKEAIARVAFEKMHPPIDDIPPGDYCTPIKPFIPGLSANAE